MSETTTTTTTTTTAAAVTASPEFVDGAASNKRVFIGNLPFRAKHDDIKQLFEDFNLLKLSLPRTKRFLKNGTASFRKMGFAFAELETPEEADRAIKTLNEKKMDDRTLSVRLASADTKKARAVEKKKKAKENAAVNGEFNDEASSKSPSNDKEVESQETNGFSKVKRTPRPRKKFGPPSESTVFINNLPVGTTEDDIKKLLDDYSPEEIRIVPKKTRRAYSVRQKKKVWIPAKVLAFAKLADEASQKKAIDEFHGKEYNGSTLTVKVATDLVNDEADDESPAVEENDK